MTTWTREHLWHAGMFLWQGRNPVPTLYESIGPNFFLALDNGWLNLGLWDGDGSDPAEAPLAVRRLVGELAIALPRDGIILDVGNGLGAQDPLIAELVRPRQLIALNITRSQLLSGRERLEAAGATAINGDAAKLPLRNGSVDGVISVEAAFHFPSRREFFAEAFRVLRPRGTLTMSDMPTNRMPRGVRELAAAICQLRAWGVRPDTAATAEEIAAAARQAGFADVETQLVGARVIGPVLRYVRSRLDSGRDDAPLTMRLACRVLLRQAELLWHRGVIEYLLLRATKPA